MAPGTVKCFNATKRFGFIQPDSGGQDVGRQSASRVSEGAVLLHHLTAPGEDTPSSKVRHVAWPFFMIDCTARP
ncbi:cold-shock protein [Paracoccus acridae]|uniref:cold-shock protein n=1 Tax=Paracoccus acridae TaxID=1795310 RepID=UPI00166840B9